MNDTYYAGLQFARLARRGDDPAVVKEQGSLWRDSDGDVAWLTPQHVQQFGLTERLREALEARPEHLWTVDPAETQTDPTEANKPQLRKLAVQGGHTAEWRWEFVQDGEQLTICLDNRPKVDAASAEDRVVEYERATLPFDVLDAIHKQLT